MNAFYISLAVSTIGGLGWLSYNNPELSRKILMVLLIITFILQSFFSVYYGGRSSDNLFLTKSIAVSFHSEDSILDARFGQATSADSMRIKILLKENLNKINNKVSNNLRDATQYKEELESSSDPVFYSAEGIIFVLLIFSLFIMYQKITEDHKKSKNSEK